MRLILAAIASIALLWAGGLIAFVASLPKAQEASPHADGIVVYTGIGGERIATAMALLGEGAGGRLIGVVLNRRRFVIPGWVYGWLLSPRHAMQG